MKRGIVPALRFFLTAVAALTGFDSTRADFTAGPEAPGDSVTAGRAAAPAVPLSKSAGFHSAHGEVQAVPGGYRCAFAQAPLPEAAADIARAWGVPVAYFGPPSRRTSATFAAATAAAALLHLADRTDLRVAACGDGWCLEEARDGEGPPPATAAGIAAIFARP